jgi:uncharacterized protein (TIGR00369 family)
MEQTAAITALQRAFREREGIEVLRGIASGELPPPPVASLVGFNWETIEVGEVTLAFRTDPKLLNLIGTVHGGLIAAILDSAVGSAVVTTLPRGWLSTTMDLQTRFHRPLTTAVPRALAHGRILHRGKRTATSEGRIVDEDGKLYATATSTLMLFEP